MGILNVQLPVEWTNEVLITVVDTKGRQLQSKNISGGSNQFDLTIFDSGIYYIFLETGGEKIVKRVVKY
ncbi:MAG: hypothetical protein ACI865_001548 [Flavobacteriaceae bacterium]